MTFAFRLRFILHGPRIGTAERSVPFQLSDGVELVLAATHNDPLQDTHDLNVVGRGFPTHEAATMCGERFRSALRKSMATLRTGFDLGKDRASGQFSDSVKDAVEQRGGPRLHNNVHGLYVFEEPESFMTMRLTAYSSSPPERFIEAWKSEYDADSHLTPRETLALELYAQAQSETSVRSRFVSLATVVEALAAGAARSDKAQAMIDNFMDRLRTDTKTSDLEQSERDSLEGGLLELKRGSIGAACRRYITRALSSSDAKEFDRLYNIRSLLIHTGEYEASELGDELTKLGALVSKLLVPLGSSGTSP
jgi:hypothetical protein